MSGILVPQVHVSEYSLAAAVTMGNTGNVYGLILGSIGSVSPSTFRGLTIHTLNSNTTAGYIFRVILSDATVDPGQDFFRAIMIVATDNTATLLTTASADTYLYDGVSDRATWEWLGTAVWTATTPSPRTARFIM